MTDDFKKEKYWKLVEEFVQELKTAKYWLKPDGKPNPEWKLFEAETWAAAGAAAWDAARDAAWDAARDAAGAVAWAATWDAAIFARMLVCLDLEMDGKHLVHLNARMEVWRKGYALKCDVNGVLYVYAKKK